MCSFSRQPIEAAGHEVPAAVLLEQPALGHRDAGRACHQRVGVLDRAVPLRVLELLVLVAGHAVELQQPVLEAGPAAIWPERTSLVFGFQAITALARAPPADVPTLRMSRSACRPLGSSSKTLRKALRAGSSTSEASSTSASISSCRRLWRWARAPARTRARPCRARADVAEALDRVEALRRAPLPRRATRRSARCRSGRAASRRAAPANRGR